MNWYFKFFGFYEYFWVGYNYFVKFKVFYNVKKFIYFFNIFIFCEYVSCKIYFFIMFMCKINVFFYFIKIKIVSIFFEFKFFIINIYIVCVV